MDIYLEDSLINKNFANVSKLVSNEARDRVAIRIESGPRIAVKTTHTLSLERFKTFPINDRNDLVLKITLINLKYY